MFDLSLLAPAFRFVSDFTKMMIEDDKYDLAFPTRSNGIHRLHHFHYGIPLYGITNGISQLLNLLSIIQREKYRLDDTPHTFLKRALKIHTNTYDPVQDERESKDRIQRLMDYMNSLSSDSINNKEKFSRHYNIWMYKEIPNSKNTIYGGNIKFSNSSSNKSSEPPIKPPLPPGNNIPRSRSIVRK